MGPRTQAALQARAPCGGSAPTGRAHGGWEARGPEARTPLCKHLGRGTSGRPCRQLAHLSLGGFRGQRAGEAPRGSGKEKHQPVRELVAFRGERKGARTLLPKHNHGIGVCGLQMWERQKRAVTHWAPEAATRASAAETRSQRLCRRVRPQSRGAGPDSARRRGARSVCAFLSSFFCCSNLPLVDLKSYFLLMYF